MLEEFPGSLAAVELLADIAFLRHARKALDEGLRARTAGAPGPGLRKALAFRREGRPGQKRKEEPGTAPPLPAGSLCLPEGPTDAFGNPVHQRGKSRVHENGWPLEIRLPLLSMPFVLAPPGPFRMGSPSHEAGGEPSERPQRIVVVRRPFYLGKYEVTQEQWSRLMDRNPSRFPGARRPVDGVTWKECDAFLERLWQRLFPGRDAAASPPFVLLLPSEALWECACRAGMDTPYGCGASQVSLRKAGWCLANAGRATHPVGRKKPNAWGLFDMHGNVAEWCYDSWVPSYEGLPRTAAPVTVEGSTLRALRGGSWSDPAANCRSASREGLSASERSPRAGFRILLLPRADIWHLLGETR